MTHDRDFTPGVGGRRSECGPALAASRLVVSREDCNRGCLRRPTCWGCDCGTPFHLTSEGGDWAGRARVFCRRGERRRMRSFGNGFRKNLFILILRGRFWFFSSEFSASSRNAGISKSSTVIKLSVPDCVSSEHGGFIGFNCLRILGARVLSAGSRRRVYLLERFFWAAVEAKFDFVSKRALNLNA